MVRNDMIGLHLYCNMSTLASVLVVQRLEGRRVQVLDDGIGHLSRARVVWYGPSGILEVVQPKAAAQLRPRIA